MRRRGAVRELRAAELAEMLDTGQRPFLLDVRQPEELAEGAIPGAVNVPMGELERRIGEVPDDRLVVTVCRSGHRSAQAAAFLSAHGRSVANLSGGMLAWARG